MPDLSFYKDENITSIFNNLNVRSGEMFTSGYIFIGTFTDACNADTFNASLQLDVNNANFKIKKTLS